ncbi:MAG: RNA methyltransferase [Lachnospiraceae bacterium]|nr:RNA methyltransferase [Lachnospiraceae bacterium]
MITSTSNKRIREVIQLNQKAKARRERDVFVVEGVKMFLEAEPEHIEEVYVSESVNKQLSEIGRQKLDAISAPCEIVSDEVFRKISDTQTPQGILCVVRQYHYKPEDILGTPDALLAVLEDIQDPGNLGTIFRTGEGAGVTGIIMSRHTVDVYNPKTIRSTMGSLYRVPFFYTDNLQETIEQMKKQKIAIYAAHLQGTKFYDDCDYRKPTAFLIGNEGNGLQEKTAKQADTYIKIPMAGKVESLNAAIATSLLLYEAARQRRQ